MNHIFPAVFEVIWKRKETKFYFLFAFYPLIYFVGSFFGSSNFMKLQVASGTKFAVLDFVDTMFYTVDSTMLATIALYFLIFSVFRKEMDNHILFLYKDINREKLFWAKIASLVLLLVLFIVLLFSVSTVVHYLCVAPAEYGSYRILGETVYDTLYICLNLFLFFLKGLLFIGLMMALSLKFKMGTAIGTALTIAIVMLLVPNIGGVIAMVFPNGYMQFFTSSSEVGIPLIGSLLTTSLYMGICQFFALRLFKQMEF